MYNCKYSKAYLNKGKKFKTSANQLSNQAKKIKYSGFFFIEISCRKLYYHSSRNVISKGENDIVHAFPTYKDKITFLKKFL